MEALSEGAWPIFESQWLGTIRRDEGEEAAAEVGLSVRPGANVMASVPACTCTCTFIPWA